MNVTVIQGGSGDLPMPAWDEIFTDELQQARATEVWRLTVAEMREAGTLAAINSNQMRRYVVACVMFDGATVKVAEQGPVVAGKRGGRSVWNPWWTVLKDADTLASNHEDKLGLNPRRRAHVAPVKKRARSAAAADGYLAKRPA